MGILLRDIHRECEELRPSFAADRQGGHSHLSQVVGCHGVRVGDLANQGPGVVARKLELWPRSKFETAIFTLFKRRV
jgi:hypothetical protein